MKHSQIIYVTKEPEFIAGPTGLFFFTGLFKTVNGPAMAVFDKNGNKGYTPLTPQELRRRHVAGETRQDRRKRQR